MKAYKAQKVISYWLVGLIFVAFIGLQLGRIQAIADYNYTLHELLYLPANIALYFVPILFLLYVIFLLNYLIKREKRGKWGFKKIIIRSLVVASIIGMMLIIEHQAQEVSTGGIFEVEEKLHEDRNYYIVIEDKKVKVSSNEYRLIEEEQTYLISFVWNKRTPEKGKLETIEQVNQ
ncbi:hypothetical protein ACTWQB_10240 [Piscibacillus sp. B03]|uniref:hypothetical protein n=1 Tax=Piscibacillus sp. B03 TaxID=3457430 RepID=UPI003FCC768F